MSNDISTLTVVKLHYGYYLSTGDDYLAAGPFDTEADAEAYRDEMERDEAAEQEQRQTSPGPAPPYPWCYGNPTVEDCIKAGYCRRNPNCGD